MPVGGALVKLYNVLWSLICHKVSQALLMGDARGIEAVPKYAISHLIGGTTIVLYNLPRYLCL